MLLLAACNERNHIELEARIKWKNSYSRERYKGELAFDTLFILSGNEGTSCYISCKQETETRKIVIKESFDPFKSRLLFFFLFF